MTIKQQIFVNKYLEFGNASEAAMWVYNTSKRNVAAQIGYENLRNPYIKEAIQSYLEHKMCLPTYVAEAFVDVLKNGTMMQKYEASRTYLKMQGLI